MSCEHEPCPFCGSLDLELGRHDQSTTGRSVNCQRCDASGPTASDDAQAWRLWDDSPDEHILESMRKDAERYAYLRENWPELETTVGQEGTIRVVYRIAASAPAPGTPSFDPQSLDHAIDSAMEAEYSAPDYGIEAINRGENNG